MKTSSFFLFNGSGRISIARSAPRSAPPGYRVYRALAPGDWFASVTRAEYEKRYRHQLDQLDPHKVLADLNELAGDAEAVLLCWEKPPWTAKNWCHRRMAAEWFLSELGVVVDEL